MQADTQRQLLTIGSEYTETDRFIRRLLVNGFILVAALFSACIIGCIPISLDHSAKISQWIWFPLLLIVMFGAAPISTISFFVTARLRTSAWLEGSHLTVRVVRAQTVNLATAHSVALQPTEYRLIGPVPVGMWAWPSGSIPELIVTTPAETVRLWLVDRQWMLLPPGQLVALATALSTSSASGATQVVDWLRRTAATPRTS